MCVRDSKSLVNLRASPLGAILSASNPRFCQGDDTSHTADARRCSCPRSHAPATVTRTGAGFSAPSCRAAHSPRRGFVDRDWSSTPREFNRPRRLLLFLSVEQPGGQFAVKHFIYRPSAHRGQAIKLTGSL
jgi:hypothetical protein